MHRMLQMTLAGKIRDYNVPYWQCLSMIARHYYLGLSAYNLQLFARFRKLLRKVPMQIKLKTLPSAHVKRTDIMPEINSP